MVINIHIYTLYICLSLVLSLSLIITIGKSYLSEDKIYIYIKIYICKDFYTFIYKRYKKYIRYIRYIYIHDIYRITELTDIKCNLIYKI